MASIQYDKLIRDNIPDIIEKSGKSAVVETLDLENYAKKLSEKLQEEVGEFLVEFDNENDEEAVKELADIVEVVYAILDMIGVDKDAFEKIRQAKVLKNGAFNKRLLLKEVIE